VQAGDVRFNFRLERSAPANLEQYIVASGEGAGESVDQHVEALAPLLQLGDDREDEWAGRQGFAIWREEVGVDDVAEHLNRRVRRVFGQRLNQGAADDQRGGGVAQRVAYDGGLTGEDDQAFEEAAGMLGQHDRDAVLRADARRQIAAVKRVVRVDHV